MCGFFLIAGNISAPEAERLANIAHSIQGHRGPNGHGHKLLQLQNGKRALLGHQRLSIIDLSNAGLQPMSSFSRRTHIAYNGEIYNYVELSALHSGSLRSHSDTEVLLELAETHGLKKSLGMANGMWGLALATPDESLIEIARDRAGKKPVYYWSDRKIIVVASELKTVAALSGRRFRVNKRVVADYLESGILDGSNDCWLEGISSLPAGSIGRIKWIGDSPILETETIWEPSSVEGSLQFDEAVQQLRGLFDDSIRLRLRSDVPVAVTLSGGLDSSVIAATMASHLGDPSRVHAISAVSPGQEGDESMHVDRVCSALGINSHRVDLGLKPQTSFDLMEKVTWHNDGPLSSFSNIAFYRLMQHAHDQDIKVVLSGQGADELFCGYKKYFFWAMRENIRRGRYFSAAGNLAGSLVNRTAMMQISLKEAKRYLPHSYATHGSVLTHEVARAAAVNEISLGNRTVAERQVLDIQKYSVPYLTHYEDRCSMAHGVEIRLPFLDYRLIEFALSLPVDFKVRNGWSKYVVRKAFDDMLPAPVVWRRDKQGFSNPQDQWLRGELSGELDGLFGSKARIYEGGLVDQSAMVAAWNRYQNGDAATPSRQIFSAWALDVWLQSFSEYLED